MLSIIKKSLSKILHKYRCFKISFLNSNLSIGKRFKSGKNCTISKKNKITIGDDFFMGNYCHLSSNLNIGDDVMFASFVSCIGGDHKIDNIDTTINKSGRDEFKTTTICDGVWVGHGAMLMHGIKLGSGCVVAAGSVVTKDVPEFAIVGGNPAKIIRYRLK